MTELDSRWQIVPPLQRFYGGDPRAWMEMPQVALQMFQIQLERLRAQECLTGRLVAAMGAGSLKQDAHDRIYTAWQKAAGIEVATSKPDGKQLKMRLSSIGIGT